MVFRRAIAKLGAQDWTVIGIEFAIVVLGVFIGSWVNDWSQRRAEQREARMLVLRLRPQLERFSRIDRAERTYYDITRRFGETALGGWASNSRVSDSDFVVAAYQASQVAGLSIEGSSLSIALGADAVHKIDDAALREAVISLMSYNFAALRGDTLQDDYRRHVREVIPYPIQRRIREQCGDRPNEDYLILPAYCATDIPPEDAANAARLLRARPELAGELVFHLAQTNAWLSNLTRLDARVGALLGLIAQQSGEHR